MRQTHFLQQIQGGQQMEFIENEIESGHHSGQPRVSFAESTSTQYHHLLASLNLLETQTMQAVACCQTVPPKGVPNGAFRDNAFNSGNRCHPPIKSLPPTYQSSWPGQNVHLSGDDSE